MSSTTTVSQRQRVLNNLIALTNVDPNNDGDTSDEVKLVNPGQMQLYSFYEPSLRADTYTIHLSQKVNYPQIETDSHGQVQEVYHQDQLLPIAAGTSATEQTQTFTVIAPQFQIDSKDIHSTYPPQGHADQPNILPHVVFNDDHLPWARAIKEGISDNEDLIPWLALFPFDVNGPNAELRLTSDDLLGSNAIYTARNPDGSTKILAQSSNFTLSMTLQDFFNLPKRTVTAPGARRVHIPPYSDPTKYADFADIQNDTTPVEVIFLSGKLFKDLFAIDAVNNTPDISDFRFLCHVRNVNTDGMPNAGIGDTGVFSVIHSKRTGPTNIQQGTAPRSQSVHMISLELLDQMDTSSLLDNDLVAFVSLVRWTYLCQPPQLVNFIDSMRAIGEEVYNYQTGERHDCLLRAPDSAINAVKSKVDDLNAAKSTGAVLRNLTTTYNHLVNGSTIVRHRAASGQETIAWNRGPLVPVLTPDAPTSDWPYASNDGQDLQVFDRSLGIMDVTYSSAWQIGKLLASSDLGFVAALMRHRAELHTQGAVSAAILQANAGNGFQSVKSTISNLDSLVQGIKTITAPQSKTSPSAPSVKQRSVAASAPAVTSSNVAVGGQTAGIQMASKTASAAQGNDDQQPYNELAPANSTDWEVIHAWILDKLYLGNIPAHYLIGDPSFLPPESIRFFHIDPTWTQSFVDGALSVANHMAQDDDLVRQAIKYELKHYFETPIITTEGSHFPQVPKYGFFLRSTVVTIFPDLILQVPYPSNTSTSEASVRSGRTPVLVQKQLGKDILLVLLDRSPEEIQNIIIQQPPHQQRFAGGDNLEVDSIEFLFRQLYPDSGDISVHPNFLHEFDDPVIHTPKTPNALYNWQTQCLQLNNMDNLLFGDSGLFKKETQWKSTAYKLSSAILATQLNDTVKYLDIVNPNPPTIDAVASKPYDFRVVDKSKTVADAIAQLKSLKSASSPTQAASAGSGDTVRLAKRSPAMPRLSVSKATKPMKVGGTASSSANTPKATPAIPAIPSAATVATSRTLGSQHNPLYSYTVFPSTSKAPNLTAANPSFVYVNGPYAPDLIFAINILPAAQFNPQGFWLQEINIRIPLGDPSNRPKASPGGMGLCPQKASGGTRARMLRNQRWVVKIDYEYPPPTNPPSAISPIYLEIRLIPRSLKRSSPTAVNLELSFKLDEVDVGGVDLVGPPTGHGQDTGVVNWAATEIYGIQQPDMTWKSQGFTSTPLTLQRMMAPAGTF